MTRFVPKNQTNRFRGFLFSIFFFLILFAVFSGMISRISKSTRQKQREALETAVGQGILYCYTLEGAYPPDLEYLKEAYTLHYDEKLFYVDYRYQGANIYPDITIIEREDDL